MIDALNIDNQIYIIVDESCIDDFFKYNALRNGGVDNWTWYEDSLKNGKEEIDLYQAELDLLKLEDLPTASFSDDDDYHTTDGQAVLHISYAADLLKLEALERGGVDNWEWYDESLKDWYSTED
jgi:hypothetical protein